MCTFRSQIEFAIEQRANVPETREGPITIARNIEDAQKGQRSTTGNSAHTASKRGGSSFTGKEKSEGWHEKQNMGKEDETSRVEYKVSYRQRHGGGKEAGGHRAEQCPSKG